MSDRAREGQRKCCMGLTYFDRTLERAGASPRCMGVAQRTQGEQQWHSDDARTLSPESLDFKFVCLGYSEHPEGYRPSEPGQPATMPYCEGIEVAVTEEAVAPAPAPAGPAGLLRDAARPTLDHAGGAPIPPATAGGSDEEDKSLQTRFRKQLSRNMDTLFAAVTGEKLPQLPVQVRNFESVEDARQTLTDTASVNLLKMRVMAEFISCRTMDAVRPFWERLRSGEAE